MTRPFDPEFDVIYSDEVAQLGDDPRRLRRLFAAGHLIRVRRGAYVLTERWLAADERMRHLARVHAASHHARERFVVAGTSAAAVWDAPVFAPYGDVVEVLDGYRGGGRSEPGVRRLTSAAEHDHAVTLGRLEVTDVARTAIDLAAGRPLPEALAAIDWAISHRTPDSTTPAVIRDRLRAMGPRRGVRVVWRAAELAVGDSGSGGESYARGVVHELGFEAPVCQLEVVDAVGRMFADFAWPGCRVIVEFDGWLKYADPRFNHGDPLEKVRRERARDARLRALGWTVVHAGWAEVRDAPRLARLLADAGVPRRFPLVAGRAGSATTVPATTAPASAAPATAAPSSTAPAGETPSGREAFSPPRGRGSSRATSEAMRAVASADRVER
ncbi:MAG TPA: type IV toxin-antitoxin system AbiEi family antitoxin domain-containing protein [Protaetiibacter sp.]|nr:type IV toxin-antitoxin system AbiEi family antitoxin domain-containing protein [Protaetiibacter sp.]